jgi:glucan 1,3-beta-glucosidase
MLNRLLLLLNFLPIITSNKIRGTSLGSLFVLEPFINPSLFYPFLGNNEKVISDTYSFCDYLGPYEANKILRKHWSSWVNESIIETLSKSGLNTLRIPVGDYMFIPYGPYAKVVSNSDSSTCFSGSIDYLDLIIDYAGKYGLKVIIDIHAWKDSQNGFDNSGQAKNIETYKVNNTLYFKHWGIISANWIGDFDINGKYYKTINHDNINYAYLVIENILIKYKDNKYVWGLSPINEPWQYTPLYELKRFYKNIYDMFIIYWPTKSLILHDSFRPTLWSSCDFLDNELKVDVYLDTHQYIAWNDPVSFDTLIKSIQNWQFPETCFKVIVGEFSLATDNCMMWLNGFMDNLPNYPFQQCHYEQCPYYNYGSNNVYINNAKYGPFGTGTSSPNNDGNCPITTPISKNNIIGKIGYDEKIYASSLFQEFTKIYEKKTEGWLFWNFKTESDFYSWNYISSYNNGYIIMNDPIEKTESPTLKINYIFYFLLSIFIIPIFAIFLLIYNHCRKLQHYKMNGYYYISIDKHGINKNLNYEKVLINNNFKKYDENSINI